eukprot:18138-Heterococcus_DN1.PRE.1
MDEQQFLNQTANSVGEPVFLYNLTTSRPGCAVVAATPLKHLDFKSIKKSTRSATYNWSKSSHQAAATYHEAYQEWRFNNKRARELAELPVATIDELKTKCDALGSSAVSSSGTESIPATTL